MNRQNRRCKACFFIAQYILTFLLIYPLYYVDMKLRPVEAPAKEDIMNGLLKINLQLFADVAPAAPSPAPAAEPAPAAAPIEPTPAPAPAPAEPAPQLSTSQKLKQLWEKDNVPKPAPADKVDTPTPQPAPSVEPPAAPAQPEKIMNKYDSVGDLVKAHQSLQSTWNRDHQALLDTQKVIEQLKAEKAEIEAKLQTPVPAAQQPVNALDELAELDNEALLEKLMVDPKGVITKMAEQIADSKYKHLESKIAPVVEREEAAKSLELWNEAVEGFASTNSDMPEYLDGMKQYIKDNNLQNSKDPQKVLNDAYAHAKSRAADAKIAEANAKVAELEAKLRTSKEDAIREHLSGVRNTQNQLPNTIAGNSNSGAPATPPLSLKGKPMADVHKAASAFLFGGDR